MGDSTASKLPAEILLNIFGRIDNPIDLSKCTCVNKMWSSIANDHHLWLKWCLRLWVTPLSLEEKENVKEKEKERFAKYPPTIAGLSLIKSPKVAFVKWYSFSIFFF